MKISKILILVVLIGFLITSVSCSSKLNPFYTPMGTLTATSDPSGATVEIHEKIKGATPLTISLEASEGMYTAIFSLDGYKREWAYFYIKDKQTTTINVIMHPQ